MPETAIRGGGARRRVGRRSAIGVSVGAINGVEIVAIERGLGAIAPELVEATAWLVLAKGLYDVERAPLSNEATEDERRAYFDAVGADLGDGELGVVLLGRGEPLDLATIRPRVSFGDWLPALLDRPSPVGVFLFGARRDVAVLIQRRTNDVVARILHDASPKLVAALARDQATKATRALEERARVRALVAEVTGLLVADAKAELAPAETLFAATPWHESSPARRLRQPGPRDPDAWLGERLALLAPGSTCFFTTRSMMNAWLEIQGPSGTRWLAELGSGGKDVIVLSGDGARALVLRVEEHEDVACVVSVRALLDRAASLDALDARVTDNGGLRLAAPTGPRDVDPADLFSPSRRLEQGKLADASKAAELLDELVGDLDMAERLPEVVKREGIVGTFSLSIGHEVPLAFRTVFTFDAGQWLVDLWNTDLDRLIVARPDEKAVLAIRRVDDAAESFLGPRKNP